MKRPILRFGPEAKSNLVDDEFHFLRKKSPVVRNREVQGSEV